MQDKFLNYFMQCALSASKLSTCCRASVGCVVVSKDGRIISTGYNGAPKGCSHCNEVGCYLDETGHCIRSVHAEANALLNVSRESLSGGTLFCTHKPCLNCTKLILNTGIVKVYYHYPYDSGRLASEMIAERFETIVFSRIAVVH